MQKLVDAVQKASPIVWQSAYRQVYVELGEAILGFLLLIIAACVLFHFAKRAKVTGPYDDGEVTKFVLWAGTVLATFLLFPLGSFIIDCVANPTYQAVKNLKGLL